MDDVEEDELEDDVVVVEVELVDDEEVVELEELVLDEDDEEEEVVEFAQVKVEDGVLRTEAGSETGTERGALEGVACALIFSS